METGLGPLLYRGIKADAGATASPLWPFLHSADLTARMISADQSDAMGEILHACEGNVPPLTILKGISICGQYYPEPHLRTMRDLDFLVDENDLPAVEALLDKLGYRQQSKITAEWYKHHHHAVPRFHPGRGIWVEVHRRLFPPNSPLGADQLFSVEHVKTQLRPATFLRESGDSSQR